MILGARNGLKGCSQYHILAKYDDSILEAFRCFVEAPASELQRGHRALG